MGFAVCKNRLVSWVFDSERTNLANPLPTLNLSLVDFLFFFSLSLNHFPEDLPHYLSLHKSLCKYLGFGLLRRKGGTNSWIHEKQPSKRKGITAVFCPICPYAKAILPKYLLAARQQGQNRNFYFYFIFYFQRVNFNLLAGLLVLHMLIFYLFSSCVGHAHFQWRCKSALVLKKN